MLIFCNLNTPTTTKNQGNHHRAKSPKTKQLQQNQPEDSVDQVIGTRIAIGPFERLNIRFGYRRLNSTE
jgi:hypothetical protein